jgi:PKD repeat protein
VSITATDKQKVVQNISLEATGSIDMPVPNFEADTTEIFTTQTVHFENLSEHAITWEWHFVGGTPEISTEQHPTVLYENAGNFDVKLIATNEYGTCEKLIKNYIIVHPAPIPIAGFEADRTTIFENETVNFTDLSENNPTAWTWHFEGGTPETSAEQNPVVHYKNAGSYAVTLIVENAFGSDLLIKDHYITVVETIMPIADFVADTTDITAGESIRFTNLSRNATTWEWYFEGGTPETSTERHPTVLYENKGSFDVKLTATNDEGSDEMLKAKYIVVITDTVMIKEQKNLNLTIYPNPTTGEIRVTVCGERYAVCDIEIFDVYGRKGERAKGRRDEGTNGIVIDISELPAGVYFLKVVTNKGEVIKKVVKL